MSLLPTNSTVFEREAEIALHKVGQIDVDALKRMRDPWACSAAHLPFLAYGRGVDLWYADWPEHRKRRITAESYRLHGLKGTLPGAAGYLAYVDAAIVEAVLPPQSVIARPQDPERQRRFRERFAQIRLYPYAIRAGRSGAVAKAAGVTMAIAGAAVAHNRDSLATYGRRAVLLDGDVETQLRSIDTIRLDTGVALPVTSFAINRLGRVSDAVPGRAIVSRAVAGPARGRLVVVGAGARSGAIPAGFSGVDVLDVSPERVHERHGARAWQPVASAGARCIAGSTLARQSQAERYIYDRWYLFDAARAGGDAVGSLGPVVGRMVAELSPHHAYLRVDARFEQRGRSGRVGRAVAGRVVAKATSDRIERVGAALYRAKALHDTLMFTTRTHRPATLADLTFGRPYPFDGRMVPINRRAT